MHKSLSLIFSIFALAFSPFSDGRYLSAYSGFHMGQQRYLGEAASLNTLYYGARLDSTHWRRKARGWLARGGALDVLQGQGVLQIHGQLPVFQWDKLNGLWLDYELNQYTLEATLSESSIFLANNGDTTSITADSSVSIDHQVSKLAVYWYEKTQTSSPINYIGGFYQTEVSPASSTITGTNASLFDGTFNGFGLTLGRKRDKRGFNFQWTLNMAQLDSDFSNDVTAHRAASKSESTIYQLGINLNWHYRYYLAPYWYLVPEVKVGFSAATQTTAAPEQVDHDALVQYQTQSQISLQKRF